MAPQDNSEVPEQLVAAGSAPGLEQATQILLLPTTEPDDPLGQAGKQLDALKYSWFPALIPQLRAVVPEQLVTPAPQGMQT